MGHAARRTAPGGTQWSGIIPMWRTCRLTILGMPVPDRQLRFCEGGALPKFESLVKCNAEIETWGFSHHDFGHISCAHSRLPLVDVYCRACVCPVRVERATGDGPSRNNMVFVAVAYSYSYTVR